MEYSKSIIPIIEANYSKFTVLERNIADYFRKNKSDTDFSAKTVAEKLFVSEASLSRFAKKCGFRGYREFIYQYKDTLRAKEREFSSHTKTVLDAYQELLDKTYNLVDEYQIVTICRYMAEAARVFVCGKGSSGVAANEMESRFMRVGVDIDSCVDGDIMRFQAVFRNDTSLCIGITVSGETEDILYFLREAHKRRAKTVIITAQKKKNFEQFCDEVVIIPSLKYLSCGNMISPQFPILVIVDIIYAFFVSQDKPIREQFHDSTLKALRSE